MRRHHLTLALALALGTATGVSADDHTAHNAVYAAAVAAPDRPAAARELDEGRKPAEVLAFFGLKPGMTAADLLTGEGYWAEIMDAVVGEQGAVIAYQPEQFYTDEQSKTAWAALEARSPNVTEIRYPFDAFAPPAGSLDFALINLSYHDLYWTSERYKIPLTDPDAYLAALYAAMRPGAVVGVIDHAGEGTDTRALVDATHRIDPSVVRADFERAGFEFVGETDILRNPEDDYSVNVFDPAIRGKTDRFVYKFRRPAR
ncbi:class I SAM-dependent methyltransferase [Parerythrobacter lacustris]|uniref:Methyltransferase n=1 Tax=Parerythrobacter lacustris TaxID=2969984 RepID=A0ABT1XPN0_9SPHN|nr:methyltransferase [Parerythrobacter lacustris]MCR2833204.1 methyltransferase [Parerythrobacter lacustris]